MPLPVSTNDRQKKSLAAILGEGNDCAAREACRPNLWGEIGESKYATDRRGYWGIGGCQSVAILYDHTVFPKVPAGFTFYIFYDRISYKPQASSCNTIKAAANRPPSPPRFPHTNPTLNRGHGPPASSCQFRVAACCLELAAFTASRALPGCPSSASDPGAWRPWPAYGQTPAR